MTHKPSFGYCVEAPIEWPDLLALARELDANSRFDSFWMPDAITSHSAAKLEPFSVLAAVAQATSRLRLGTLVAGNAFRHPAVLAQTVATVDQISGGRLTLGIGAGWPGDNRRYGIEFWRRPERIARVDEALQVMKLLWTADRPRFAGRYYSLDEPPHRIETRQQPHPPILVGGGVDPMLRLVAAHADAASPMIAIKNAKAKVDGYCHEIGRDPAGIRWAGGGSLFMHDDPATTQRAITWAAQQYNQTEDEVRAGGLFGTADDVRDGVRQQIADGADDIIVFQLPRVYTKSLIKFSDEVISAFA
jgi:alkanesulfonate monooxygenase SsuD/methylene tetrahydromethanopterin reductase-like flavin-dependent oxidoreductase (luciferase family)